ncbi:agmatinase family protein (plasmid) [Mesorhizobium sp. AR02]|uniref:agmatinase family protein n=1 Tax=Mesorhizobium sp. AR02 TaxID=2865837 RepID=UPI00215F68A6|nr:agmatinase family protein [Mesorhizobium sp. AR02]UVK49625.1 agmatinase family protein [Mesorhizobium sp. AR02]
MTLDFIRLLETTSSSEFSRDPRPGWSGPALLFGARSVRLDALAEVVPILVAGIPFDATSSSRPGAADGPTAIRQASLVYSSYIDSLGETEMLDTRTGQRFRYCAPHLADVGDLHVYPTDPTRNFRAIASEARDLATAGQLLVLLGGDHSITFPAFAGWQAARMSTRLGYIHVDHHFDFGDVSAIHGKLYHGSTARRISELPAMVPQRIAFVGQGSVTRSVQFENLQADGYHIVSARRIREQGARVALADVLAGMKQDCDEVYLSVDIDVLDCSVAPGTGNVTLGGLWGSELLDVMFELGHLPIGAFDISEVAPRYDSTGRTAQIAARILFELLYKRRSDAPIAASFAPSGSTR